MNIKHHIRRKKKIEDTEQVTRSQKSKKDRQHNDHKKKEHKKKLRFTIHYTQNAQNSATRPSLHTGVEFMCSERVAVPALPVASVVSNSTQRFSNTNTTKNRVWTHVHRKGISVPALLVAPLCSRKTSNKKISTTSVIICVYRQLLLQYMNVI